MVSADHSGGGAVMGVLFNPMDPEFLADPYPTYHRLRAEDPVHRTPMGFWILTRYDDVATVLRDARFGRKGFDELIRDRFGENLSDLIAAEEQGDKLSEEELIATILLLFVAG